MKILCLSLMFICAWPTSLVNAEVYKWTDEQGRVHYGDRPSSQKATKIDIKQSPEQPKEAADWQTIQQRQKKYLDYLQDERQDRKEDQAKIADQKAERKKLCDEATDYYKQLQATPQWYREDENGNKVFLDHTEKDQEIAKAKQLMDKYCAK